MIISPGPRIPTNLPRYNKTTRSQWLTIFILNANSTRIIIRAMIIAIICRGSILVLFLYNDDCSVQPKKGIGYGSCIPVLRGITSWGNNRIHKEFVFFVSEQFCFKKYGKTA
jgi:hypothetical protein